MKQVLVAEDTDKVRAMVVDSLIGAGYTPLIARTGLEAVSLAMEFRPRVVLLDGLLPYMHGFDVVRYLRSVVPDYRPEYLFMTAIYRNNSYRNEAKLNLGISRYLVKPFSDSQLIAEMDSAWRASREQLAPQMVQLRAAV